MSKRLNELMVQEIAREYTGAADCVVINYQGITAEQSNQIRNALGAKGGRMRVLRNRVAARGIGDTQLKAAAELLDGPTALVTGDDIAGLCKVITEWAKENGKIEVRGGTLGGALMNVAQVEALADIPPIEVLYTQMAGLIQSPLAGIAGALQAIHRQLAVALEAIRAKKEETQ